MTVKCSYADKYQGKREPTCGCEVCGLKWQIAQLQAERGEFDSNTTAAVETDYENGFHCPFCEARERY